MSAHTKYTNKVSLSSINCFWINIRSFRGQVCLYLNFHKSKTQYNANINRSVWFPGFPLQAWKVIYFSFLVWWNCYSVSPQLADLPSFSVVFLKTKQKKTLCSHFLLPPLCIQQHHFLFSLPLNSILAVPCILIPELPLLASSNFMNTYFPFSVLFILS